MNVLVLGSGGREHAIAWKVKQSKNCTNLFCLPGNPGTAQIATNVAAGVKDFEAIKKCVLENNIEIVICGPEDPLVFGLKDMFAADDRYTINGIYLENGELSFDVGSYVYFAVDEFEDLNEPAERMSVAEVVDLAERFEDLHYDLGLVLDHYIELLNRYNQEDAYIETKDASEVLTSPN